MNVKDLIIRLLDFNPQSEVIFFCDNGILNSYVSIDDVEESVFDEETAYGLIDERLWLMDSQNVVLLSSDLVASYINHKH